MNSPETPKHDGQHLEPLPEGVAIRINKLHDPEAMEKDEKTFAWMDDIANFKKTSPQYIVDKNSIEIDPNSDQA